jgi:holliday junction DNA helicase RuvB
LNPFTLVAATTRAGLLSTPLRERFGIPLRLEFYSASDLQSIVLRAAGLLKMDLLPEGALEIAKRSRGTPRVAGRLTRRVRDIVSVHGHATAGREEVDNALQHLEIDARGLDAMDRRYLQIMVDHYAGGPVGIETLAATLGEERDVLEDVIEPYLIQEGLVQRTPRGRQISSAGYAYLGLNSV